MVNIYCGYIDKKIIDLAKSIANHRQVIVKLHTPTETLEVSYEKASEGKSSEEEC